MCTCCRYTITTVRVTAHHQQQSEVLTYSPHQGYACTTSKVRACSAHLCGWHKGNFFSIHCGDCITNLYHERHIQLRFMLAWFGQGWHVVQTCCCPLWWAAVLCWLTTCGAWEVSQSLDPGRLNSMPVKSAQVFWCWYTFCLDLHCKSGLVPHSLMYATDIRVTPLDPPTQLLTWPHCSSSTAFHPSPWGGMASGAGISFDAEVLMSRYFLCHFSMFRIRHASQRCFTASTHLGRHLHCFTHCCL